jgi:hypothetical protein
MPIREMLGRRRSSLLDIAADLAAEGFAVSDDQERTVHEHIPGPDEPSIPELEEDENIAPRPEEEIADELRAEPDVADHSHHSE